MKCEVCLKLLAEYIDSELVENGAVQVSAHLTTCAGCALEFDGLTAEQEIYARYDRALKISPSLWGTIAVRTGAADVVTDSGPRFRWRDRLPGFFASPASGWSSAGAIAVLIVAAVIGVAYLRIQWRAAKTEVTVRGNSDEPARARGNNQTRDEPASQAEFAAAISNHSVLKNRSKTSREAKSNRPARSGANQSDVLFTEGAYSVVEEQETQKHIEQAQNLLRSVRNIQFSEDETEIDVSYEKALSRQLLNENVVLRRDAEMSGKFPVKTLLSSLEPFLLDIANLPDKTSPEDLRVIKDRVQKTEIVAALHSY